MRLHLEDATTDKEELFFTIFLQNTYRPGFQLGDQWCVTWRNTQFTRNTRGNQHPGFTGENLLLCAYDVTLYRLGHSSDLLKRGCLSSLFLGHFSTLSDGFFNTTHHV